MKEDIFQLGVKALIVNQHGKFLLLKVNINKLQKAKEAYWDIPGGRIHRNETVESALKREVEEETGIESISRIEPLGMVISKIRIPHQNTDTGLILYIHKCVYKENQSDYIKLSEEHSEYNWFNKEEVIELLKTKYPEAIAKLVI